jgi:hypothetical protein
MHVSPSVGPEPTPPRPRGRGSSEALASLEARFALEHAPFALGGIEPDRARLDKPPALYRGVPG